MLRRTHAVITIGCVALTLGSGATACTKKESAPTPQTTGATPASSTPATTAHPSATTTPTTSGGHNTSGTALPTGQAFAAGGSMCSVLAPGDFEALGVTGASTPTANTNEPDSWYCTYTSESGAQGGIEFDAFVSQSSSDSETTYQTAKGEIARPDLTAPNLRGIDEGALSAGGNGAAATILVRKGRLVIAIAIPSSSNATHNLEALAQLVLERASSAV